MHLSTTLADSLAENIYIRVSTTIATLAKKSSRYSQSSHQELSILSSPIAIDIIVVEGCKMLSPEAVGVLDFTAESFEGPDSYRR